MDLERAILRAYQLRSARSWEKIYLMIDVHGTIAESNYKDAESRFYPEAIDALQKICLLPEVELILWTSSYPQAVRRYQDRLASYGIPIPWANMSPIDNTSTGDFTIKPYFSILIDDKAGFDPEEWPLVSSAFLKARSLYS